MSRPGLPAVDLSSLLTILGDAVTKEVLASLEGTGLRRGHGYLVQQLLTGPSTATEMATELGITQQAVSKAVKELETLGHVELTVDPVDSRRRPVRLTRRGHGAVSKARSARQRVDDSIREALGPHRFDRMVADLEAVLEILDLREDVLARAVKPPAQEF